jgi:uncharacterized protein YndB with AHSA1/START domain
MITVKFSASVHAPKQRVWYILWEKSFYEKWVSLFSEGSTVKTDNWKEGSEVQFVDSNGNGMLSIVAANRQSEYMSFEHIGMIKDSVRDTSSDEVKGWAGAKENYTLKQDENITTLTVEMDTTEEHKDFFSNTWPKAMDKIKELAEAKTMITVSAIVNGPIEKVWNSWTKPAHIVNWNHASDDWHTPRATNDLRNNGRFTFTMAAKDGSFSFDFGGTYTTIEPQKKISYIMDDGRVADVLFEQEDNYVKITENFQAENMHSLEMQEAGWQAILNNFKKFMEGLI